MVVVVAVWWVCVAAGPNEQREAPTHIGDRRPPMGWGSCVKLMWVTAGMCEIGSRRRRGAGGGRAQIVCRRPDKDRSRAAITNDPT